MVLVKLALNINLCLLELRSADKDAAPFFNCRRVAIRRIDARVVIFFAGIPLVVLKLKCS